jgi:hypothetical protein
MYTYGLSSAGSKSRLDRIYVTPALQQTATDWPICHPEGVETDHQLVSVRLSHPNTPYVGQGRWVAPTMLLQDRVVCDYLNTRGRQLEEDLDACVHDRTALVNPQTLYQEFKKDLLATMRARARVAVPRLEAQIRVLQSQLETLLNNGSEQMEETLLSIALIQNRITDLSRRRANRTETATAARYRVEGETISKYWSKLNATCKPRDIVFALERPTPDGVELVTRSDQMAKLAGDYHNDLQSDGLKDHDDITRAKAIFDTLNSITSTLPEVAREDLSASTTEAEVAEAIRTAENGKAAGLDGLPYELWKVLHQRYLRSAKTECPTFNVVRSMTKVFNDIEQHGLDSASTFTEGWMCPIFKPNKLNKRDISNYRPITLLNTDYKVFTKALTTKLARHIKTVVHEDQAGFIRGRSIHDQVRLAQLMVDFAEAEEVNGVIIALDQEKAYDKIRHDYLWDTMEAFGLPPDLIRTVQALHTSAFTYVIINCEKSPPFRVTRGVRQGDPLSCLLFNIAIEPLACLMRASSLKGIHIPGIPERKIASLFADDTTTYYGETPVAKWTPVAKCTFTLLPLKNCHGKRW